MMICCSSLARLTASGVPSGARLWRDVHANVTRNHSCKTIDDLMRGSACTCASTQHASGEPASRMRDWHGMSDSQS